MRPFRRTSSSTALVLVAARGRAPKKRGKSAIYSNDVGGRQSGSRLKWFVSTCVIAAFGFAIISTVIVAAVENDDGEGLLTTVQRAGAEALRPVQAVLPISEAALLQRGQKSDFTPISTRGTTTRSVIHDMVVEQRSAREFIRVRPYVRIMASLGTEKLPADDSIPPFDARELHEAIEPVVEQSGGRSRAGSDQIVATLADLDGGLTLTDGVEMTAEDAERDVTALQDNATDGGDENGEATGAPFDPATMTLDDAAPSNAESAPADVSQRTTVIEKSGEDGTESGEATEVLAMTVKAGDTVATLTRDAGSESWQAAAVQTAMATLPAGRRLRPGQELRFTLVPQALDPTKKDPIRVVLLTGGKPDIIVRRVPEGSYVAQLAGAAGNLDLASLGLGDELTSRNTLYNGIYQAALAQHLPRAAIDRMLRVNSYDIDYKQAVRTGDRFELFFATQESDATNDTLGELLYAAVAAGGAETRYYRYRTADGQVDYFDGNGSNSKKFLMRQPVRGGRFTSGFGYRRHPLLGILKMHTGVDWAAPPGTPILAAGAGVVEEAGRLGGYGNYVRIRHGNGYKTAYGHMQRFSPALRKGGRVTQGQVIGYVGTTGLSSGPHLHYEVLVDNRYVDPAAIKVPRGRQLTGRALADFKREQQRIDELMQRAPVQTRVANIQ